MSMMSVNKVKEQRFLGMKSVVEKVLHRIGMQDVLLM
jgi:hypothetical protein